MTLALPRFTFINGPSGSGKSTLSRAISASDPDVWCESFAEPIRQMIYAVFFPEQGPIHFETDLKDGKTKKEAFPFVQDQSNMPWPRDVKSFRDVMISFSEDWMKPTFGDDIFGRLALRRCVEQEMFYNKFVFDDCGFPGEVMHIAKFAHPSECLLIRLHRAGCNFSNDSRGYIALLDIRTLDIFNDGTPEDMLARLEAETL